MVPRLFPLGLLSCGLMIAACGGSSSKIDTAVPSSPASADTRVVASPAARPTAAGTCPVDTWVCEFSDRAAALALSGNAEEIVGLAKSQTVSCAGAASDPSLGAICEGAGVDEYRQGYVVAALQSEGSVLGRNQTETIVRNWLLGADAAASDDYGSGAVTRATVGCAVGGACDRAAAVVFTRIRANGGRDLFELSIELTDTGPAIATFVFGSSRLNRPLLEGGGVQTWLALSGGPVQMVYSRY